MADPNQPKISIDPIPPKVPPLPRITTDPIPPKLPPVPLNTSQPIIYPLLPYPPSSSGGGVGSVTANTSGVWISVKDDGARAKGNLNGLNTNQVNWGIPYPPHNPENRQSAYRFDGLTEISVPLDGMTCLLGTFTHFNYTITDEYSISEAVLKLTINIVGVGAKEFNLIFQHNETPNKPGDVPDIVSIPDISAKQEVVIYGKRYELTIIGFLEKGMADKAITRKFVTSERRANAAELFCSLELIEEPSPPPTCYLIILPPCPCPPPPVAPTCVIYPPTGLTGGQSGPIVIPGGGQTGQRIVTGQQGPGITITGGQTGQRIVTGQQGPGITITGGQTGQTGFIGGQTGQTGFIGGQTGQTGFIGGQTGQTGFIGGQTGQTITQQISSTIISVSSIGIWLNVVEEVAGYSYLTGVGTNQISWGIPVIQGNQSCYLFEGITTTSVPLDGSYFTLGTFTHYNYAITGYSIRSAILQLTVKLNEVDVNFSFQFNHNEVANEGINGICPLTPGFAPPCPDIVSISNSYSQELVTINQKQYALCIVGFIQNNQIQSQFITIENQVNVAQLLCQFVEVKSPTPSASPR